MGNSQSKSEKSDPKLREAPDPSKPNYKSLLHQWNAATDRIKTLESKIEQLSPIASDKIDAREYETIGSQRTDLDSSQSTQRFQPSVLHSQRPDRIDGAPPDPIVRVRRRRRSKVSVWRKWAQKSVASLFQF